MSAAAIQAIGESRSLCGPNISQAQSLYTRHIAWLNSASGVAQMVSPLLGNSTSASTPSASRSAMRSSGV
jgi:hypothetical protein